MFDKFFKRIGEKVMANINRTTASADPNNVQVPKGFVFNETGNIMMATTDMQSHEIEQSVRDVFAEVSVFFAAMTRALENYSKDSNDGMTGHHDGSIPHTVSGAPYNYSLYDYKNLKTVIDSSGCFVQVNEEDITHTTESFGATFSKELVEAVLGLATGTGELAFAKAMVSSVGQAGFKISQSSTHDEKKVANIIFVCEYLLGMPVISAIVITADMNEHTQALSVGPCFSESSSKITLKIHKDTYMFVTPAFITKYSPDLISGMNDPKFVELVNIFEGYLTGGPAVGTGSLSGSTGAISP